MALWAAFTGAALLVYGPALSGPFVSDDNHYVATNVYIQELSPANLAAILHPTGDAAIAVVNYTPVHLLLHAAAWSAFGADVRGHHTLNVLMHALASLLLAALLAQVGVPPVAAVLGGAAFLLHPANVEAVAWISQLKTSSSMLLSLASLLAFGAARPGLGTLGFALALLAKPTAAFVLPVAVLLDWARRRELPVRWYVACALLFAAYAAAEFAVHQRSGAAEAVLYETPLTLVRTVVALTGRYLAMALTSIGVSAFHEPEPSASWLEPWWLLGAVVVGAVAWRSLRALRRREPEVAFWAWLVVSFAPVSQVFPFLYPMADRYLYFMLPGLIGALLLAGAPLVARLAEPTRRGLLRGMLAASLALLAVFAVRSHARAEIWRAPGRLLADAAAHYPDGVPANLLAARRAAQLGDARASVAALRRAVDRGYNRFEQLLADPALAPVRAAPEFQALVRELAGRWIERALAKPDPTQLELLQVGRAHFVRGERREAEAVLRRALARGGSHDDRVRAELDALVRGAPGAF